MSLSTNTINVKLTFSRDPYTYQRKNVEIPLGTNIQIVDLSITQSTQVLVPYFSLHLKDSINFFKDITVTDGSVLQIDVKYVDITLVSQMFSITSFRTELYPAGINVYIDGYMYIGNTQGNYVLTGRNQGYNNSIASIVATIADRYKLDKIITPTIGVSTWMQGNKSDALFVKYLADRAWYNKNSYFVSAIAYNNGVEKARLIFSDVDALLSKSLEKGINNNLMIVAHGSSKTPHLSATSCDYICKGGLENKYGGYAYKVVPQNLSLSDSPISIITIHSNSAISIPMCKEVNRGLIYHVPIGAKKSNLCEGILQNTRHRHIANKTAIIILDKPSHLAPLVPFVLVDYKEDGAINKQASNSMMFIVASHTLIIRGSSIGERIEAVTMLE